jgi:hypothetical protein
MKKPQLLIAATSFLITIYSPAQKVGIGAPIPKAALHIAAADSGVLILQNNQLFNSNVDNGLFFLNGPNGTLFTGAVKTTGLSTYEARLGFFTFTQGSAAGLKERMSIMDDGKVGIATLTPRPRSMSMALLE